MDVPILRTLAWKSILGFGKYKLLSIQQIFDLGHTAYLRYIYYNIEGISFNEEILTSIYVISKGFDDRIKKPGINTELGKKIDGIMFNFHVQKEGNAAHTMNRIRKGSKIRLNELQTFERQYYSKQSMQRRNHGK
jgi:hypothetical protein